MNAKYLFGSILTIPLLPVMYYHGKQIRAKVPKLPEAKGVEGIINVNADKKLRLLAIGESTIAGVGIETHEEGFTGTLAKELAAKLNASVSWKVYAKSGYTAKKVKEEILPEITEQQADLIVIGLGGNDAFTLNTPSRWRAHSRQLIRAIRAKFIKAPIVFTNMPPIKSFPAFTPLIKFTVGNLVEILGEELEDLISQEEEVYFYSRKITPEDWLERLKVEGEPADFFSDGVHPSRLTYQVWAKDFANFLIETEAIGKTP